MNMLPDLDTLETLPGPYELLEFRDGMVLTIKPLGFQVGKMRIVTTEVPGGKDVVGLRLMVSRESKPTMPQHWDITSMHLVAGLVADLQARGTNFPTYKITWIGVGKRGRAMLDIIP